MQNFGAFGKIVAKTSLVVLTWIQIFGFLTMFGIRHHIEILISQGNIVTGGFPQRRT